MQNKAEQRLNEAAYWKMKGELDQTYPMRQFVAFGGGNVIADSADFDDLLTIVTRLGRDPMETMVVRIGEEDLRGAMILMPLGSTSE